MILNIILTVSLFVCSTIILIIFNSLSLKQNLINREDRSILNTDDIDYIEDKLPTYTNTKKRAVVFCSADKHFSSKRFNYKGQKDCNLFKLIYETENGCTWGCIGFGSCLSHCPQDSIIIQNNTAVITESCNGCGLCIPSCPNNLIKLIPTRTDFVVQCSSHDKKETTCSNACTACGQCTSPYAPTGFTVKDNLAVADYSINHDRALAASKCPTKSIKKVTLPEEKAFTFWKLWYNILHRVKENGEKDIWE